MRVVAIAVVGAGILAAQDTSATVSGVVRDPTDAALAGVKAELKLEQPPNTLFSLRVDEDGRFKFTVLPAGTYALTVACLGFKPLKVKSILVASAEQKILPPLRMDLAPTDIPWLPIPEFALRMTDRKFGNLSGRVGDSRERPISRATVKLFCDEKVCGETKTDAIGEFIFLNLSPRDDYAIRVTRFGYYPWQWTDFTVQAGYDCTYGAIVLRRRVKLSRAASTVR
jgi:hypothetical protein